MRTVLLGVALVLGACAARDGATTGSTPTSGASSTTTSPTTTSTTTPAPTSTAVPVFQGDITPVTASRLDASWRPGCPVAPEQLRLVAVDHWDFDGQRRRGELVVHADYAEQILGVFRSLFDARFPLQQMRLVDEFGGDDDRSMAANNTSAFNCRAATGSDRWSEHAYGRAIDINPVQNPYVTSGGKVLPPEGADFVNRDDRPGVITADGPVVTAFNVIGWGWGGAWRSGKDYQHFSATGR